MIGGSGVPLGAPSPVRRSSISSTTSTASTASGVGGRRWRSAAIVVPLVIAVVGAVWSTGGMGSTAEPAQVIASDAPHYRQLDELVRASDAVVLAEVVGARPGRALGGPGGGIVTQLFELRVVEVVAGSALETVVLEEVVALGDGTSVAVDGVVAPQVGERGVFFLVAGDANGYAALVGPQGRYLVDGDGLVASAPDDALASTLAAAGGPELVAAVRAVVETDGLD